MHEGLWRNGSASDSRSEGWEFESLWPHFARSHICCPMWKESFYFGQAKKLQARFRVFVFPSGRPNHVQCMIRCSIVVSISACHAEDPGSIPGGGVLQSFSTSMLSTWEWEPQSSSTSDCSVPNPLLSFTESAFACRFPSAMTWLAFYPSEQASREHRQPMADQVGVSVSSAIV